MHTQEYIPQSGSASLVLLEAGQIRTIDLDSRTDWLVGRPGPQRPFPSVVNFSSAIVSREHGWLRNIGGQWFYVDNPGNLNGTYYNGQKLPRPLAGIRQPVPLEHGDLLRIDSQKLISGKGVLMLFLTDSEPGRWDACPLNGQSVLTIGRDASCDIVLPQPYLSGIHAKISYINGQYYLSDCGSKAGTLLNGDSLTGAVTLREKDCITLCDRNLFFLGDRILFSK